MLLGLDFCLGLRWQQCFRVGHVRARRPPLAEFLHQQPGARIVHARETRHHSLGAFLLCENSKSIQFPSVSFRSAWRSGLE